MKRRLIAAGIFLAAALVLPLMAAGASTAISLGASSLSVVYGHSTTLSGSVSTHQKNQRIVLQTSDCTSTNGFSTVATLTTGTGGAFSYTDTPELNTTYMAQYKNTSSNQVSVRVHPYVGFVKLSKHRYRVRVKSAASLGHHYIAFQRVLGTRFNRHYRLLKRLRLASITRTGPNLQTFVSGQTFRSHLKAGLRIRMYMRTAWTGPCYVAGWSRVIQS